MPQEPGRNRREGRPARPSANEQGLRDGNNQTPDITEQRCDVDMRGNVAGVHNRPQPTPSQEKCKRRTNWTTEMNEFVTRCYYQITKIETSTEPYGAELHRQVIEKYPQLKTKTMQNILDQRRSIFRNKRLPAETINRIKDEVEIELGMKEKKTSPKNTPTKRDSPRPDRPLTDEEEEFQRCSMLYNGVDPTLKPHLPKLAYNSKTPAIIHKINNIVNHNITRETTIAELHSLIYAAAYTVLKLNKQKVGDNRETQIRTPPWERRLQIKIEQLRKEIGILTQNQRNPSNKVKKVAAGMASRYRSEENPGVIEILDHLKQKLAATAKRLRRYRESNLRKQQNTDFATNQRNFYRNLKKTPGKTRQSDKEPNREDILQFWSNIWSTTTGHRTTKWYHEEKRAMGNLTTMLDWQITTEDVKKAITRTLNWKTPGPDKIQNFWLKKFTSTHEQLAICMNRIVEQPNLMPTFMTKGNTYLIPKTPECSADPSKYRPITCLPTVYKILTSIISNKIYAHLETNKLLDEEQKGCRKRSKGCKEQLIIDSVIVETAKTKRASLYTAYIDYQKAFDSVPHTWLKEVLALYGVEEHLRVFMCHAMDSWSTNLVLNTPNYKTDVGNIRVRRGIFQGDALSPLWFCLALRPLTTFLNRQGRGYTIPPTKTELSHLWYMDDLKLYASTNQHLQHLLKCVERFSMDIEMAFGMDKCRISSMRGGKWERHEGYEVVTRDEMIMGMEEQERYKYLGYQQARGIDHANTKKQLQEEYQQRLKTLLKTKLSAKNLARAVSAYANGILTYSYGVIKWTDTDLGNLDTMTRVMFTKHRAHHPRSSIERFHLNRKIGGRGIPSAVVSCQKQVLNLREYFYEKKETSQLHMAIVCADKHATPLQLAKTNLDLLLKAPTEDELKTRWKSKALHGRYITAIEEDHIDTGKSQAWLRSGNLFPETEGFVAAIQDQVMATRVYRKMILKQLVADIKCRLCGQKEETLDHLLSGCSAMAPKQYLDRHNRVAKIVHIELRKRYQQFNETTPYYEYEPPPVCEDEKVRIYWNRKIITDKPIPNNIPDIVLTLKNEKITYIIDVAIPLAANITKTTTEKINKYLPLADEIKDMWSMDKVIVVPVVIGATGEIPKRLDRSIDELQLDHQLYIPIQKSVLLDTCAIVRRALNN